MWTRCTTLTWAPHQRRRSSRGAAWDPLPNWLLVVAFLAWGRWYYLTWHRFLTVGSSLIKESVMLDQHHQRCERPQQIETAVTMFWLGNKCRVVWGFMKVTHVLIRRLRLRVLSVCYNFVALNYHFRFFFLIFKSLYNYSFYLNFHQPNFFKKIKKLKR